MIYFLKVLPWSEILIISTHITITYRLHFIPRKLHFMKVINSPICIFCSSKAIANFFFYFVFSFIFVNQVALFVCYIDFE